ncbi:hypothetical protein SLA2020_327010 [Shorea laevis]
MAVSTMIYNRFPATLNTGVTRVSVICASQVGADHHLLDTEKLSNQGKRLSESLLKLVQLTIETPSRRNLQNRNWVLVNEIVEKHDAPPSLPRR